MPKTQRAQNLSLDLDYAFQVDTIVKVWKKTVRNGLRKQPLEDIHDFLDIHRNIKAFANRLRKDVLHGYHKPSFPEFVYLEKRDGIPRRLAVPEPADALALQCLVEVLESELKKAQPSQNAYYSRTHMPGNVEQVDGTFAYPWWILWPEFQKRICKFASSHEYIVVADVANYFDCIPLLSLRNTLASCGKFSENLLNFLFYLLEAFSWRPYYMPHSGVGLPQINFDAPRLLAHAYLFKLDEELEKATNGDFVRWMDDLDAGVNSREEGKKLLRNVDNVLSSQGLKLNSSKSKILSAKDATAHFWIQENRALTIIQNSIKHGTGNYKTQGQREYLLKKKFKTFDRKKIIGQWEKVLKRYFTLFGMIKDPYLEKKIPFILDGIPSLRGVTLNYMIRLGISKKRLSIIETFLLSGHCEDDVSLFEAVRCLVTWETPANGKCIKKIVALAHEVTRKNGLYSPSRITAGLWLLAKYGSRADLMSLIASSKDVWEKSAWTARQVAAITPLLDQEDCLSIAETITQNGLLQALQVLAHFDSLKRLVSLDHQLNSYIKYKPSLNWPYYSLQKIILAIALLQGELDLAEKENLSNHLLTNMADRRYKFLISTHTFI